MVMPQNEVFYLNGDPWQLRYVDPSDRMLVDRTGTLTLATTDPKTFTVYISNELGGELLSRVLIHEIGHCVLVSFDLLDDIHKVVRPEYWIDAEEWICNFISEYGLKIFNAYYYILGDNAWRVIPAMIESDIFNGS